MDIQRTTYIPKGIRIANIVARWSAAIAVLGLTAWSAILVKESTVRTPLVQAERLPARTIGTHAGGAEVMAPAARVARAAAPVALTPPAAEPAAGPADEIDAQIETVLAAFEPAADDAVRWFDGRRVVPVRTIWMKVTAYSPDARSCGKWADGQTATMHSVWTNAMRLVAADTRILPYGSIITVPGYADSEIVPVLDCGGAIKGNRLDVLFPTHEIARRWGVRDLAVTVWAYEDELEG